jgi:hypothetical protein
MLSRLDRVQLVVRDRLSAARPFERLLGAAVVGDDRLRALAARRRVLRVGESEVDLLEADGAGPVADFAAATRGGGLFAVGFASETLPALRERLARQAVRMEEEGGLVLLEPSSLGLPGLRLLVSAAQSREPAGRLRFLYEATWLVHDWKSASESFAAKLGLDAGRFEPIRSEEFGYAGTLTLLDRARLDRIEAVTPSKPGTTMSRFFSKRGACLYMAYGECDDTAALRAVLEAEATQAWTGPRAAASAAPPDNLWIHPAALSGLLLGVSRTTFAWTWSGHPERVVAAGAGPRRTPA